MTSKEELTLRKIIEELMRKDKIKETNLPDSRETIWQVETKSGNIFDIIYESDSFDVLDIDQNSEVTLAVKKSTEELVTSLDLIITGESRVDKIKTLKIDGEEYKTYSESTRKIQEIKNITQNGTYVITMITHKNEEKTVTIIVNNIGVEIQTANHTISPSGYTREATILLTVMPEEGAYNIVKPNGESVTGSITSYAVIANGNYDFTISDFLGNEVIHTVAVSNIDRTPPEPFNATVTASGSQLTVGGTTVDYQSGIAKYQYRNNNGAWQDSKIFTASSGVNSVQVRALDLAGNERISAATTHVSGSYNNGSGILQFFGGQGQPEMGATNAGLNAWGGNGSSGAMLTVTLQPGTYRVVLNGNNFQGSSVRHYCYVHSGAGWNIEQQTLQGHWSPDTNTCTYVVEIPYARDWTFRIYGPGADSGYYYGPRLNYDNGIVITKV